jgi:CDI immunity proteins
VDLTKTLQDLDGRDWGEPTYPSRLVTECHRLRRVPLANYTVENLRLMIGQEIGLAYLVPLAVERLAQEPFVAGDFYEGDLLRAVVSLPQRFWDDHSKLRRRVKEIASTALAELTASDSDREPRVPVIVRAALK